MDVKYQIAILGPGAPRARAVFLRNLRRRLRELDADLPSYFRFLGKNQGNEFKSNLPSVGLYFGGVNPAVADRQFAKRMVDASAVIIPVFSTRSSFHAQIPRELHGINGEPLDPTDRSMERITNLVLENLGLLRRTRRLFISYRRADSAAIALQLRHLMDEHGYDVFLDTHSVPKGDEFQEVLWHRLADSDIMVLLDSPDFLSSPWTQKELAQAGALTVAILQLVWPSQSPPRYSDLAERIYLRRSDFNRTHLRPATLRRVAQAIEELRARSIAARHNILVRDFCDAADLVGVRTKVQPERFVLATTKRGRRLAAIPSVGVPDALRHHEASRRFPAGGRRVHGALLIYDHRGLRPSWVTFLDWLDDFLPVKAVRVTMVADRLARR